MSSLVKILLAATTLISSEQAFEIAHKAIEGRLYYDQPCDIEIKGEDNRYTVTFSIPMKDLIKAQEPKTTDVVVDTVSGVVLEVRNTGKKEESEPRFMGLLSGRRALEAGLAKVRGEGAAYDKQGPITVALRGERYLVTFDDALQVWVDARTGTAVKTMQVAQGGQGVKTDGGGFSMKEWLNPGYLKIILIVIPFLIIPSFLRRLRATADPVERKKFVRGEVISWGITILIVGGFIIGMQYLPADLTPYLGVLLMAVIISLTRWRTRRKGK